MLRKNLSRRAVARLITPLLALVALAPVASPASALVTIPGCGTATNFSDISSANVWVSAGFSDGTAFSDHDSTGGNGAEAKGGGGTGVSPAETDMIGSGETLTTAAPHSDVPTIQYYHAGTAADCYTYFRLRIAAPAEGGGGDFSSYSYKYAIGNATTGTIGWFYIGGAGGTNTRSIQDAAGNNVVTDAGWTGMGGDDQLWWADTSTANADNIGYWVSWKYSSAELATAALTVPGLGGVFGTRYGILAGTTTSGNGTVWNKDCTDGFPPTDANQPPNSLDSCIPDLNLWKWLLREPAPTLTITNGVQTGVRIDDTRTAGSSIAPVTINAITGTVDSYTIACDPALPQFLQETPTATTPLGTVGTSVTDSSTVSIAGVLSPSTPAPATYHCVITAWGPGGTATTDYYLHVLPIAPPSTKLTDGVETKTAITDTQTTGSRIDTVTLTVDPTSGPIDTYTIDCTPPLPPYLVTVPSQNTGETVTSASQVSISGVVADTATVGTYHCTITAHGPGGTSETYYTLVVKPVLTLAVIGGGSVNPGVGTHPYLPNETVTVTATPNTGWHFTGWTGACAEGPNPITVTMDASKSCTANFALDTQIVTYSPGTGSGTLSGGDTRTVNYGDTITVATPTGYSKTGWHFTGWLSGSAFQPGDVETITTNRTFTAQWAIDTHTLTTDVVGSGTVTPGDVYNYGDTPTITAVPATGWHFVNWTGDCSGSTNPLTVTMTSDKSCTANFAIDTFPLTTAKIGSGTVTLGGTYNYGDTVTVTATPASGWRFVGWDGDCAEGPNPITLTMNAAKSCTARFEPIPIPYYKLTVSTVGDGTATPGTNWYIDGSKAVAVAKPAAGWFFTGWTGACTGTAPTCEVLMTMDKAVTATFVKGVTITTHTNGSGSVKSSQPTGTPLLPGTKVTLTATPDEGWEFAGWSGSCSGTENPLTVTLEVSKDCTATFTEKPKPVVEPLVAKNDTYRTTPNTPLRLPAGASILRNDGTTITKVQAISKTQHGKITLAPNGKLVYTPNKGFTGVDSFKYKAFDANGRSVIATVKIVVAPKTPTDIKTGR